VASVLIIVYQDYASAHEVLASLQEQSSNPSRILFQIFLVHLQSGDLRSASSSLEKLHPRGEEAYRQQRLGSILLQVGYGRWAEAESLARTDSEAEGDATVRFTLWICFSRIVRGR
jgi:hypothetical protein